MALAAAVSRAAGVLQAAAKVVADQTAQQLRNFRSSLCSVDDETGRLVAQGQQQVNNSTRGATFPAMALAEVKLAQLRSIYLILACTDLASRNQQVPYDVSCTLS